MLKSEDERTFLKERATIRLMQVNAISLRPSISVNSLLQTIDPFGQSHWKDHLLELKLLIRERKVCIDGTKNVITGNSKLFCPLSQQQLVAFRKWPFTFAPSQLSSPGEKPGFIKIRA